MDRPAPGFALRSPYLLLTLDMLCWAGNWVIGRAIHEQVPPFTLNFWREAGSLLLILPVAWRPLRDQWPLLLRHWKWVLPMVLGLYLTSGARRAS